MSGEHVTPPDGPAPGGGPHLGGFQPLTGTAEQWNAAYVRVEDYLRAHRIHSRLHQSRVIERVLAEAARRHAADPRTAPVTLAADVLDGLMQRWFAAQLQEDGAVPDRLAVEARVAMLLSDLPSRWPYAFLDEAAPPEEARLAMESGALQAGPDLAVSSMVPREMDLGVLPEAAGGTLETLERWPLVRLLLLWALFAAVMAALFFKTR